MAQAIILAKKILLNDGRVLEQGSVARLLIGKLIPLVSSL